MRWRALLIAALVLVCGLSAWLAGGTGVGVSLWGTRVSPASRPPFPSTRGQPHAITPPGTTLVATATPRPAGARTATPALRAAKGRLTSSSNTKKKDRPAACMMRKLKCHVDAGADGGRRPGNATN
jgi:hypothetical protein